MYHLVIVLFSILISLLIPLLGGQDLFSENSLFTFLMLFFQLHAFMLIAKFLFPSRKGKTAREITWDIVIRFLAFYLSCLIASAIIFFIITSIRYVLHDVSLNQIIPNFFKNEFRGWGIFTNLGLLFGAFIFFIMQWQDTLKREQKLKEENLVFKYETLKNQVNPHFLFNSLNTLSSFISTDPKSAEKYVSRLAVIYRYITDNSAKELIPLEEEIEFVKDFFYLHKMRDNEKIDLNIEAFNANSYQIIPVSLQILIENALKHNIASTDNPLKIDLFQEGDYIVVRNNLQKTNTLHSSLKLGLKNLDSRVHLSTGMNIIIKETASIFTVKVPLKS
jgi:two-component system LytT family sensor kinase